MSKFMKFVNIETDGNSNLEYEASLCVIGFNKLYHNNGNSTFLINAFCIKLSIERPNGFRSIELLFLISKMYLVSLVIPHHEYENIVYTEATLDNIYNSYSNTDISKLTNSISCPVSGYVYNRDTNEILVINA